MEKRDILLQIIQHYTGGNKAKFARMIGITPNGLSTWISRNTCDENKIVANCEGINPAFLFSGEGPITLEGGLPTPAPSSETKKNEQLTNELLTICHILTEERQELRKDMEDVKAILHKSQQQFDRVLTMVESLMKINNPAPAYTMVAEDNQSNQ